MSATLPLFLHRPESRGVDFYAEMKEQAAAIARLGQAVKSQTYVLMRYAQKPFLKHGKPGLRPNFRTWLPQKNDFAVEPKKQTIAASAPAKGAAAAGGGKFGAAARAVTQFVGAVVFGAPTAPAPPCGMYSANLPRKLELD